MPPLNRWLIQRWMAAGYNVTRLQIESRLGRRTIERIATSSKPHAGTLHRLAGVLGIPVAPLVDLSEGRISEREFLLRMLPAGKVNGQSHCPDDLWRRVENLAARERQSGAAWLEKWVVALERVAGVK